ncbi:polysaccharide biosynthesis tyrosine autokinase [Demequina subtropica]|uniref:polysaccharide biosynthesis tyrosine autokinase n=1 Tax=Demequina subtropica TaxID=1638989 RepID=UPI000782A6C4|nr:polysaccharide biosynthesis tyrosine autokinase [Demequina subtropica]
MELRDYLVVLRRRWIAIALCTVLVGGLAFVWVSMQPRVYSASSTVIVTPTVSWAAGNGSVAEDYAKTRIGSYAVVAKSDQVALYASEQEGLSGDPYALGARVSVTNPGDTALLRFTATGATPESARRLAEVWVEGTTLAINEIESTAQDGDAAVTVTTLEAPRLPMFASSPKPKQSVAVGLVLGLVLGIAYAFVRASLDRRVRTREDVEKAVGAPVVGILPWDGTVAKRGPDSEHATFPMTEAVRQLRTNLQFMDVDHPPRVIVVTSPLPGDGKSTTSVLLAQAIAESGRDVVLIDADLRRPSMARALGLVDTAGLTSVLAGQATAEQVLQEAGPTGRMKVMTSGPIPPNPSELVGSEAMRTMLYSFPDDAIVLVDSPPLLPVTDASVLAARTDGALVVLRAGSTTVDTLTEALAILERVRGRALGVVLNRAASTSRRLAYTYTSTYTSARPEPAASPATTVEPSAVDEGEQPSPDSDSPSADPALEAVELGPEDSEHWLEERAERERAAQEELRARLGL